MDNLLLFLDGLQAPDPVSGLRLQVRDRLEAGVPNAEMQAELEEFRLYLRENGREAEEDHVLDVMDCLVGWCNPANDLRNVVVRRPVPTTLSVDVEAVPHA